MSWLSPPVPPSPDNPVDYSMSGTLCQAFTRSRMVSGLQRMPADWFDPAPVAATPEAPPSDPKSDAETLTDRVVKDLGDGVFNRTQRTRIGDAVRDADRNANAGRAIGGGGKGYGGLRMGA